MTKLTSNVEDNENMESSTKKKAWEIIENNGGNPNEYGELTEILLDQQQEKEFVRSELTKEYLEQLKDKINSPEKVAKAQERWRDVAQEWDKEAESTEAEAEKKFAESLKDLEPEEKAQKIAEKWLETGLETQKKKWAKMWFQWAIMATIAWGLWKMVNFFKPNPDKKYDWWFGPIEKLWDKTIWKLIFGISSWLASKMGIKPDLPNVSEIWNEVWETTPEKKEEVKKKIEWVKENTLKKLKDYFKKYNLNIEDSKLKAIIERRVSESTFHKIIEQEKMSWLEAGIAWIEITTFIPLVIWDLWKDKLIPTSMMVIQMPLEYWYNKIKIWLKAFQGQDISEDLSWSLSYWIFEENINKLAEWQKIALIRMFYTELWYIWSVLWWVSEKLASLFISWSVWVNNYFKWINTPIDKLQNILNIIKPWEWKWLDEVKKVIWKTEESYKIIEEMKKLPKGDVKLTELSKKLWEISHEIDLSKTKYTQNLLDKTKGKIFNPTQFNKFSVLLDDVDSVIKANVEHWNLIQTWKSDLIKKWTNKLKSFKIKWIQTNAIHLTESNISTLTAMKEELKYSPKILWVLGRSLPVIVLSKTLYNSLINKKWEHREVLLALNPIIWWAWLLNEASINWEEWKKWKIEFTGLASAGIWAFLIWTELIVITKEAFIYSTWRTVLQRIATWWWRAVLNSFVRVPLDTVKFSWEIVKWSINLAKIIKNWWWLMKVWWQQLTKSLPWYWKIAWLATIVVWGALTWSYWDKINNWLWFSEENIAKKLEEEWIMKNWQIDYEKLWEKMNSLWEKEKQWYLEFLAVNILPDWGKNHDKFDFEFQNGVFNIKVKDKKFYDENIALLDSNKYMLIHELERLGMDATVTITKS